MTLYRETLCEHGFMGSHYICDHLGYPAYNQTEHTDERCHCPGGTREEVAPNIEAAESQHRHTPNDVERIVAAALTPQGATE